MCKKRNFMSQVRVIAIMFRNETVGLRCHFHCHNQLLISKAAISINTDHFRFPYGTANIMCPLPSGCELISYVAITSTAVKNEGNPELRTECKIKLNDTQQ